MNKKNNKREENENDTTDVETHHRRHKSPKSPTGNALVNPAIGLIKKRQTTKRGKKAVKFADPIFKQLLFDKPGHSNEHGSGLETVKQKSTLNDLEPPLSLVAHLDLAARKLNVSKASARSTKSIEEPVVKASPSIKSTKSTLAEPPDSHVKKSHS